MEKLEPGQFSSADSVFQALSGFNLSLSAVLARTIPGDVWVDRLEQPRVGFASTPEGHYLSGDPSCVECYLGLEDTIPEWAYLIPHQEGWKAVLDQVWITRYSRPHPRRHYVFHEQRIPDWKLRIPEGFQLEAVDERFLRKTGLKNHASITDWIGTWHSEEYFLQHGFGFCLVAGDTIAAWCITDCVVDRRCEIGIRTDARFRRRGLGTLAVAAAVDHALQRGFNKIGWHCLRNNTGSMAVAEKVGFRIERDYVAYSASLPAENPEDLTVEEYRDWAMHYESAVQEEYWYAFYAAEAWTMAGEPERALQNLQTLFEHNWQGRPEWLEDNWRFEALCQRSEFRKLVEDLRKN